MASRRLRERPNDYLPRKKPTKANLTDIDMEYATLEAREASFAPPTKRSKAGWPHKSPSPKELARAGFFYKPTSSKDNVECFVCGRHLDGWEADDDALQEHLKHGPDCAWALLMSIERETAYDTPVMDDPTGAQLTEARRNTFETIGWPHEAKRGWACKTEKMVEAGWHFAPTTDCDDYTSCVYCKLSLDGWEPNDSPFEEHYRRSPDCPFFMFAGTTPPSNRPKKKAGRASRASRASRTSKASRLSTQSNTTLMSQADESTGIIEIHGVDTTLEDTIDNSIVSIHSTTSTATTKAKRKAPARGKAAALKKAKTTRGRKKEPEPGSQFEEEPEAVEEELSEKKSRSKKKQKQQQPDIEPEPQAEIDRIEEQPPAKKSMKKKKESATEPEPETVKEAVEEQPKRKSARGRKKELTPEPNDELKAEPQAEAEADPQPEDIEIDHEQAQEEIPGSYPVLPEETPDEFEDAEEEPQIEEEAIPHRKMQEIGPPEKEGTPIPVKQISPLKEQSNPPRPTISPAQREENRNRQRSSRRSSTKQSRHDRSPSQPSDVENQPPSSRPHEVRPPLSSPGAPPPRWTPVDIERVFQNDQDIDLFGGSVNGALSEKEKEMTVQEWIEHIANQAESSLSAEGEKMVNIFEREGQRALAALESIQCL